MCFIFALKLKKQNRVNHRFAQCDLLLNCPETVSFTKYSDQHRFYVYVYFARMALLDIEKTKNKSICLPN